MSAAPTPASADAAARALREAAALIREDPNRSGSLLTFGNGGQIVITADMHGNLKNFDKLQRFCALERSPGRSVILQELIHQEVAGPGALDTSIDLLVRAAEWKCAFPDNVFFLQSNHELAQLRGQEITKGGRSVLHDFEQGVAYRFGRGAGDVLDAVRDYIAALPLAARTASGVFISHSLPDPLTMEHYDFSVFDRVPTAADLAPGGAAYGLVWGRFHTPRDVEYFANRLGVEAIVVGHTPQEFGYVVIGKMIILASDHNHGTFLPLDLSRKYTMDEMEQAVRRFVSVA
jgi:Calcineurin-like phosphoesterase